MSGAVRIAFAAPVARAAWDLFCEKAGFVHAFRMKGGGDVFRKGGVQVTAWGEGAPDGAAPADAVSGAIVQAFGTGDPAEAAAAARTVLRAFPASLEGRAEPPGPAAPEVPVLPAPEARAAPPPAPARPRPLSRPRPPAAAFAAVPTNASEAVALLGRDERAALLWLPADGSARDRRGDALTAEAAGAVLERWSEWTRGAVPAEPAKAVLERLSDWTVGDPRRVVSARLCLCVREHGREAPPGAGEFWRLTSLGAAVRDVLQAAAAAATDDAEAP